MSAIQEALERVRREREASQGDDLSWVESAVGLGPSQGPRKRPLSLRLGLVVLAGIAIGVTASQISWTGLLQGAGVFSSWLQGERSGLTKNQVETLQAGSLADPAEQKALSPREPSQVSLGKEASGFLLELVAGARKKQQEGDLRGAEKELLGVLQRDPNFVEALVALADLYVQHLSEAGKAIALYQKAIQKNPKRASYWVNLGVAYLRIGDLAKAEKAISSALELDSSMAEAHYNMACALALQGRGQEAAASLARAASMDSRVFQWAMEDPDLASVKDFFPGKFEAP